MIVAKKTVSVIVCHESDIRPPVASPTAGELLLVEKRNGTFEVKLIDALGEAISIDPAKVKLTVLTSDNTAIVAEEPVGATFKLKGVAVEKTATITVTLSWISGEPEPATFQLVATATEKAVTVVLAEPKPGEDYIDVDVRKPTPTPLPAEPPKTELRKAADAAKEKRKSEAEAKDKEKATKEENPHATPAHEIHEEEPRHGFGRRK